MKTCEMCAQPKPNCGPFRTDDGKEWALVCGGCKLRYAFAQPGFKDRLEQDIRRALLASMNTTRGQS